jgi:hypothetical protein
MYAAILPKGESICGHGRKCWSGVVVGESELPSGRVEPASDTSDLGRSSPVSLWLHRPLSGRAVLRHGAGLAPGTTP